jgi:type IV secretory pathway VirB10-like protein
MEQPEKQQPEKQQQPESTSVVDTGANTAKKPLSSGAIIGAAVLFIIVVGGFMFLIGRGKDSSQTAYTPTAADQAQQKADADRAAREQRQIEGLRDADFFIRDEDAVTDTKQLTRGLNTEAPKPDYSWEAQKTEEEAINYILRGNAAQERRDEEARRNAAADTIGATGTTGTTYQQSNAYQQNNSRPATDGNNNNNNNQLPPMFVYSRTYGGARYTEPKAGNSGQTGQSGQSQDFPFTDEQLLRMALTGTMPPSTAAKVETEPVNDVQTVQTADKQTRLIYTAHPPVVVHEGEMLEAVLVNKLIVDVEPSPVICTLSRDLYDKSGKYVVFPANSQVIGAAQTVSYKGAGRLFISFHRIILPNGLSVDLPQSRKMMKAMDETGAIGVVSNVNRHWMLQFGAAIMLGVFDGIAGYAQRDNAMTTAGGMVIGRTSENFGRVLDVVMDQYSSIMPTISVFQGKTMRIYIADDMVVSPYQLISERSYYGTR